MDVLQGIITYPVEGILKSVGSLAAQEIGLFRGFNKELTKLRQSSLEIQEYLGDVAHKPQDRSVAVRNWVKKLKDVAHDADDVLEDINYEVLRRKVEIENHMKKKVLNFFSPSNPILFRQKMAHKIKNINASLAGLKSEAPSIGLAVRPVDHTPPPIMRNRETDSRFCQNDKIIGREEIVSDIIKILMSKTQEKNLSVMTVVGIGGLGKTTLAKSIFNDDAICTPFVEKIWVCVSDTFEVNSILNRMLESLDPTKAGLTAREALLKELAEKLKDNRYILIIDDVWNEEMNFWREFMDCLSKLNSGPGSIAIVTTRSANVASIFETMPIIETMPRCDLEGLSEEDCWSVLKGEALPSSLDSDKECIGRAIAKKCAGLPLAAKVLGSLMRSQEWSSILESKIWELRDGDDQIMSILKLSFDNLREPSLKQCFAYCSMFEKDCEIDKDDLVQLWMAQGYLHSSPMEDKGNEHFNILLQNSLFQDARNHEYAHRREREDDHGYTICTMHDLVHDLAEKVFKFESLTRDLDQMDVGALDEIQHVARISSTTLDRFPQRRLRSLFPPRRFEFSNIFQKFRALRTLNLFRVEIEELPSSIGKLKRLRYLNISETEMKELPKSVGKLYNLQTLRMSRMWALKTFPREMENLINLRHVYFDNNVEVPFGMTRLTHLQTLPSFNLDEDRRHRLDELGGLNELKGKLVIGALEYVRDKEEAMKSKLVEKAYLQKLILKWGKERNGNFLDEDILEGLQPHPNLKSLTIEEFKGTKFASWMMRNCQVTNLRQLRIMSCEKLSSLCCGLEYCPSLETVEIKDCSNLESFQISPSQSLQELKIVGCPKLRCTSIHSLPSLRKLVIEKCTSLKESENLQQHQQVEDLSLNGCTSLRKLRIMSCEKFSSLCCGLEYCPSLETVEIEDCSNLESFQISPSQSLQEFKIVGCPKLRCTSIHSLPSLCKLVIKKCTSLEESENLQQQQQVEELSLNGCTSLRDLFIENCNGFTSILSGLHSCTSLRTLSIRHCPNLRTLSGHGLQTPVSLEKMEIWDCPNLKAIPSLDNLTSLTELIIRGCGGLISLSSGLAYCTSLTHLDVSYCCNLEDIPSLDNLTSLTELIIRGCDGLISLSSGLAYCTSLTRLDVSYCCNLEDIPSLDNLTSLTDLIIWECDGFTSILSGLPSCTSLRTLCIRDCRNLRTLSGHGLQTPVSLEKMEIRDCPNLEAIPSLDNLTSLTELIIMDCDGLISLPSGLAYCTSLTILTIFQCDGLISLPSGLAYCTSLTSLRVHHCPNLEAIPSLDNLTSLTNLDILGCDGLISLPSGLAYCTSLTRLRVSFCSNLISLADHNVSSLQSLSSLSVFICGKLQYLPKGLHSLSRLEELCIGAFCQELDSFPDFQVPSKVKKLGLYGWPKLKSLPQHIQHSASLTELTIWRFDGLEALPEWLGNLTSLTKLSIWDCKNLMYLPTVEAMQRLTKLHDLEIYSCPRLKERCAKDSGPEWPKISHIPYLSIYD